MNKDEVLVYNVRIFDLYALLKVFSPIMIREYS